MLARSKVCTFNYTHPIKHANTGSLWVIVRKAYKKRALATHPDRFVSGSAVEKSFAEEQFRKVCQWIMAWNYDDTELYFDR